MRLPNRLSLVTKMSACLEADVAISALPVWFPVLGARISLIETPLILPSPKVEQPIFDFPSTGPAVVTRILLIFEIVPAFPWFLIPASSSF